MIKSMTGYGRGEFIVNGDGFSVEVKALNGRFLDINYRSSERFFPLELKVREELKKRFSRGTFSVYVNLTTPSAPALKLNTPLAKAYMDAGAMLKKELGASGDVGVDLLLRLKDIFVADRSSTEPDADWDGLKSGLDKAFAQMDEWRQREGLALRDDLLSRLASLEEFLVAILKRAPVVVEEKRRKLRDSMQELLKDKFDEQRLIAEAAIYAERCDISEEAVRLKSHTEQFRAYMGETKEPVGKRLDFLCQEILREINTMGSKSSDIEITRTTVEMKGLLEKIREQVQNVE